MKQRKVVSLIGALVLLISAVVLITGCSQPNSNKGNTGNNSGSAGNNGGNTGSTDILKKDIIEFETASVKCTNTNSYTKVTSGSQIQEKDKLLFEAILPTGKVVENWYINDVKQKYNTDSAMGYKVKASDIASGTLKISVVFK